MKSILYILLLSSCCAFVKYAAASTIISVKDGNWEDSATWNIDHELSDTLEDDTIIIGHHVTFNNNLLLSHCYLQVDTPGSLCGHDTLHLYYSTVYQYGGIYVLQALIESSGWSCLYGYWIMIESFRLFGIQGTHFSTCCFGGGHVGGGFTCPVPVQSWNDTTSTDTSSAVITLPDSTTAIVPPPPLLISVQPNPSMEHFNVESEIPDSSSHVVLDVYDLAGKKIFTLAIEPGRSSVSVFTNNWAAGMYLLEFREGKNIIEVKKMVRVQ